MTTLDSTELIRVSLLDLFNNLPFHRDNFPATLSISTCSSSLLIRPILKGGLDICKGIVPAKHEIAQEGLWHVNALTSDGKDMRFLYVSA
jgi:hypothetical protein